jgi:hypothetical protein
MGDNYLRSNSENPLRVGKSFSYSYMTKDSEGMKSWADPIIYEKINKLQYSAPVCAYFANFARDLKLLCSRKLGDTIVSTYAYDTYEDYLPIKDLPLFYSVVLQPTGLPSLWEKVKNFIYYDMPFGDEVFGTFYQNKQRWLVVDFFTNDNFEKYTSAQLEKIGKEKINWQNFEIEPKQMILKIEQMENYENKWSNEEMIRQNKEMIKLYTDYLKGLNNSNR